MMDYIKVFYKEDLYGPIRAPTTLAILCNALRITPRAGPTIQQIISPNSQTTLDNHEHTDSQLGKKISNAEDVIAGGLYLLTLTHNIPYDDQIDGPHILKRELTAKKDFTKLQTEVCGNKNTKPQNERLTATASSSFPLSKEEMDECLHAMMHLIRSIPDRWVKYNKLLSMQIKNALLEVENLQSSLSVYNDHVDSLDRLMMTNTTQSFRSSEQQGLRHKDTGKMKNLPQAILVTYTQYRIIHILYETWKTAWRRFSPSIRTIKVTKIETVHAFDIAEQYLNRLWSWRRMMDRDTWHHLEQKRLQDERRKQSLGKYPTDMPGKSTETMRLLRPPPLPSGKHPRVWEYLAQPNPSLSHQTLETDKKFIRLDAGPILKDLRTIFIEAMLQNNVYEDRDLEFLLNELVQLDKSSRLTAHGIVPSESKSDKEDDEYDLIYPSRAILKTLRKEFRIGSIGK